jgi:ribonuclease Z
MSDIRPRMAVGYHFFNDFDTLPAVDEMVRKTYDGPLALATDYMVFNVTKDDIKVRMSAIDEDIWPEPSVTTKLSADPKDRVGFSDYINGGRRVFQDVIEKYYKQTNEMFGTNFDPPTE